MKHRIAYGYCVVSHMLRSVDVDGIIEPLEPQTTDGREKGAYGNSLLMPVVVDIFGCVFIVLMRIHDVAQKCLFALHWLLFGYGFLAPYARTHAHRIQSK